ncbi:hypothetical protein GMORB2_2748 [Geosmithia morbida]|uniref:Uncharacterized protein n=1 Tax=Geosmithia morbida TaxID=1094350 RepID=A0A9P4YS26_9HYPO|nr:uncharacterized protein GMORB2_2748 [Geosmithia morbida]KAF4120744.1 hypothetical protein GMORB2_2748 [Geosmithia morbida]
MDSAPQEIYPVYTPFWKDRESYGGYVAVFASPPPRPATSYGQQKQSNSSPATRSYSFGQHSPASSPEYNATSPTVLVDERAFTPRVGDGQGTRVGSTSGSAEYDSAAVLTPPSSANVSEWTRRDPAYREKLVEGFRTTEEEKQFLIEKVAEKQEEGQPTDLSDGIGQESTGVVGKSPELSLQELENAVWSSFDTFVYCAFGGAKVQV